jgi:cytochrome P450
MTTAGLRSVVPGIPPGLAQALRRRAQIPTISATIDDPTIMRSLLSSGRLVKRPVVEAVVAATGIEPQADEFMLSGSVLFSDGEEHAKLRQIVDRFVAQTADRVPEVVDQALADTICRWGDEPSDAARFCDVVLRGFPRLVACRLAGVDEADVAIVEEIAEMSSASMNLRHDRAARSAEINDVARRARPWAESVISTARPSQLTFAAALRDGVLAGEITMGQASANLGFFLTAAFETTAALLAGCVLAAQFLDQMASEHAIWAELSVDQLDRLAVDLALGEVSPVQCTIYAVESDTHYVSGAEGASSGDQLVMLLGAAAPPLSAASLAKDPSSAAGHGRFAFGMGPHRCAGPLIARAEATALLAARRKGPLASFRLNPMDIRWTRGAVVRCPFGVKSD